MATSINKVAGFLDSGWKILTVLGSIILLISGASITFYKLNETRDKVEQYNKDVKSLFQEMNKDFKQQLDDQKEFIIKQGQRIREHDDEYKKDCIEQAYWRGRVETILKMK